MTVYWSGFGIGIAFLLGAGGSFLLQQPTYVVFSLGLTGIVMTPAIGWGIIGITREYLRTELRQSIARDL
jgi:hypothetical protein